MTVIVQVLLYLVHKLLQQKFKTLLNRSWLKELKTMVPSGKKAMFFIDDLNMPRKDTFGT